MSPPCSIKMLHNLFFLVDALLSHQSVSSLQRHNDQPRYVILSRLLELPPKPQSIFHCKRGSHVYRNPGAIPSRVSVHVQIFEQIQLSHTMLVYIYTALTKVSPAGMLKLSSACIFLCVGEDLRD